MDSLLKLLGANQRLVAMAGTVLTGSLMYVLRTLPVKIWSVIVRNFTVTLSPRSRLFGRPGHRLNGTNCHQRWCLHS